MLESMKHFYTQAKNQAFAISYFSHELEIYIREPCTNHLYNIINKSAPCL